MLFVTLCDPITHDLLPPTTKYSAESRAGGNATPARQKPAHRGKQMKSSSSPRGGNLFFEELLPPRRASAPGPPWLTRAVSVRPRPVPAPTWQDLPLDESIPDTSILVGPRPECRSTWCRTGSRHGSKGLSTRRLTVRVRLCCSAKMSWARPFSSLGPPSRSSSYQCSEQADLASRLDASSPTTYTQETGLQNNN